MKPEPKPGILDISPYVGGRASLDGVEDVIKLSSNESPFGPGPKALEALARAAHGAGIYPEGSASMLREAIADVYGLDPARIVASGDGSDSILTMLANAYLRAGDEALFAENSFMVYKIATLANSAVPVEAPQKNRAVDVDALLARVTPRTKLVFVANPDNPTGSYLSSAEMARLHAGLPPTALLVIDAAYSEYVMKADYDPSTDLVTASSNVVMTRTFSKIHGLAGLRIGWCYAPASVCDVLNRIRGPFNTALLQQLAGAAALGGLWEALRDLQRQPGRGRWRSRQRVQLLRASVCQRHRRALERSGHQSSGRHVRARCLLCTLGPGGHGAAAGSFQVLPKPDLKQRQGIQGVMWARQGCTCLMETKLCSANNSQQCSIQLLTCCNASKPLCHARGPGLKSSSCCCCTPRLAA